MLRLPIGLTAVLAFSSSLALGIAAPAQAGTQAFFALCSFFDRDNDHGGSIEQMPCYVVEGGNRNGAFYHVLRLDGEIIQLNTDSTSEFVDSRSDRTYRRFNADTFLADSDSDVLAIDDAEYTDERFSVDDPEVMALLRLRSQALEN